MHHSVVKHVQYVVGIVLGSGSLLSEIFLGSDTLVSFTYVYNKILVPLVIKLICMQTFLHSETVFLTNSWLLCSIKSLGASIPLRGFSSLSSPGRESYKARRTQSSPRSVSTKRSQPQRAFEATSTGRSTPLTLCGRSVPRR